jgi:hypothetical protein
MLLLTYASSAGVTALVKCHFIYVLGEGGYVGFLGKEFVIPLNDRQAKA